MTFVYDSNNHKDNEQRKLRPDAAGDTAVNIVGIQLQGIIDAVNAITTGGAGVEYLEGINTDPATGKAILIRNAAGELVVPSAANPMPVDIQDVNVDVTTGPIIGTEDGTLLGVQRVFVNNVFKQILDTQDRTRAITYADFGTKNERVTRFDFASALFPNILARKDFIYTLVGNKYRLDNEIKSLVVVP